MANFSFSVKSLDHACATTSEPLTPVLTREVIESLVGVRVCDMTLYQRAFTHKSFLKEHTCDTQSFETLEFIGDSVLSFIITKMLFDRYEHLHEGFLTKARTKLVRGQTLAAIARHLHLYRWIRMDAKGLRNEWNKNDKILEDVFEALVGAIYLDMGILHTKKFLLRIYNNPCFVNMNSIMVNDNYKDRLMRYCQARHIATPVYNVDSHTHGYFCVSVIVEGHTGWGAASLKKEAEQNAAHQLITVLNIQEQHV